MHICPYCIFQCKFHFEIDFSEYDYNKWNTSVVICDVDIL